MKLTHVGDRYINPDIVLWHVNNALQHNGELCGMVSFSMDGCSPEDKCYTEYMKYRFLSELVSKDLNEACKHLYGESK